MSQVASGWQYLRDSTGAEGLYNLAADPSESRNLEKSAGSYRAIIAFRRSILQFLDNNPVTIGSEPEYVNRYRTLLKAVTPARQHAEATKSGRPEAPIEPGGE